MRKLLLNSGALIMILAIVCFAAIPAMRAIRDPTFEEMQDIKAFQIKTERDNLTRERIIVFLNGALCGAGITCLLVGAYLSKNRKTA